MAVWILASINGTSSRTWMLTPMNSVVFNFFANFRTQSGNKRYEEGPGIDGLDAPYIGQLVEEFILHAIARTSETDIKVCLVGYSRGGAIAIEVAQRLPIQVYFLGLIDPVNLTLGLNDTDSITNVLYTYRAIREFRTISENSSISNLYPNTGYCSFGYMRTEQFATTHEGMGYGIRWSRITSDISNRLLLEARNRGVPV